MTFTVPSLESCSRQIEWMHWGLKIVPCHSANGDCMRTLSVVLREVLTPTDPSLPQVRRLYESTLDRAEQIPWEWIVRGLGRKRSRRDHWWPHLIVAERDEGSGAGTV